MFLVEKLLAAGVMNCFDEREDEHPVVLEPVAWSSMVIGCFGSVRGVAGVRRLLVVAI